MSNEEIIKPVFADYLDSLNEEEDDVIDQPEDDGSIPTADNDEGEIDYADNLYEKKVGLDYWTNGAYGTKTSYNLLPYPYYDGNNKTYNGLTYTVDQDGVITINGTATARSYYYMLMRADGLHLPVGTYKLSTTQFIGDGYSALCVNYTNENGISTVVATLHNVITKNFTVTDYMAEKGIGVYIRIEAGTTLTNYEFKPMIRYNTHSQTDFVPYDPEVGTGDVFKFIPAIGRAISGQYSNNNAVLSQLQDSMKAQNKT